MISLIVATLGRDIEVDKLLSSLEKQSIGKDGFEVIIVDQNKEINLEPIVSKYKNVLNIKHIKSDVLGLSKNRNIGLLASVGSIVAFPDDDCTYYEDTLESVLEYFGANSAVDSVFGQIIDLENNKKIIRNWPNKDVEINTSNFFMLYSSITIFTKLKDVKFDERLGVGEFFGSYEDADYTLNLIENGNSFHYSPLLKVWHPELNVKTMSIDKIKSYGLGFGALCKKHFSLQIFILFIKAIGYHFYKFCVGMLKFNVQEVKKRYYSIMYRFIGFLKFK